MKISTRSNLLCQIGSHYFFNALKCELWITPSELLFFNLLKHQRILFITQPPKYSSGNWNWLWKRNSLSFPFLFPHLFHTNFSRGEFLWNSFPSFSLRPEKFISLFSPSWKHNSPIFTQFHPISPDFPRFLMIPTDSPLFSSSPYSFQYKFTSVQPFLSISHD